MTLSTATANTAEFAGHLSCFSFSISNHIAHLVLNKPEALNTMHPTFWRELDAVLTALHKGTDARVLVISSTGKHFSAGMALETFAAGPPQGKKPPPWGAGSDTQCATVGATSNGEGLMNDRTPEGRAAMFDVLQDIQSTFTKIENLRIPVIAAIHGGCIGGAVDMVTACCIRYASSDAFFASRKSTLAWWPTWAPCSACPS